MAEACHREHVEVNPPVRALVFLAELGVYVAVYEPPEKANAETDSDARTSRNVHAETHCKQAKNRID